MRFNYLQKLKDALGSKCINASDYAGFVVPLLVLVSWFIIISKDKVPEYLLPSPISICREFIDFALGCWKLNTYAGTLWEHSVVSIMRVFSGFGLAVLLGLPLGYLSGRMVMVNKFIDPFIQLMRSIPGIGWLPLVLVWVGIGEQATIILIAMAAFFPIYINTAQGAARVSPLLLRAGKMLGAGNLALFTTVIVPASLPTTVAGLRLGMGLSWAYLVLGELTGVSQGLGAVMMDARMLGHVDIILVAMIYIALWGRLSDWLITVGITNLVKRFIGMR